MNSDEGQDRHDNDDQADKIDDPVHGRLLEMKKNAYEYKANTKRLASSRVPFRAAWLVVDPIRAWSDAVPNLVEAVGPSCEVLGADTSGMPAV